MSGIHVTWMGRRHRDRVIQIEQEAYGLLCWDADDFAFFDGRRGSYQMAAFDTASGEVLGFAIYQMHEDCYELLNIAVDPLCQRQGVGRALIERIAEKLDPEYRDRIICDVGYEHLAAIRFFRGVGFRSMRVVFGDSHGVHEMERRLPKHHAISSPARSEVTS